MFRPISQYCLTKVTNVTNFRYGIFDIVENFSIGQNVMKLILLFFLAMFILFFNKKP